jgi:hypothetical protein
MRDLRKEDVPLLRNIIDVGAEAIESTYNLKRCSSPPPLAHHQHRTLTLERGSCRAFRAGTS